MSRPAPPGAQAVLRAVAILKSFSEQQPELHLRDLCARLDLTRTTTHRLLAALESEGLVERQSSTGAYRLGPEAVALGQRAAMTSDLRSRVRPVLAELARSSGETATLEVPIGAEMLILDEVLGRHLVAATAEIGTRWPLHATSTGRAFLAALPHEDARRLMALSLQSAVREGQDAPAAPGQAELERRLAALGDVCRRGYAVAADEVESGFVAVGAVFRDRFGEPLGAVSVGGPKGRLEPRLEALGQAVLQAARELDA